MQVVAREEFVNALQRSQLLNEEQMAKVRKYADTNNGVDADRLAEALVQQNGLTRWQAQRLLAGESAFYLGRYRFVSPVGEGAHGVVFQAVHSLMKRTVAIKILSRARLTHRNARARFRREVQAIAKLNHPNIVAAFDAGQVGETQFLVMEHIDGNDLRTWSEYHRQLDIDWACEFVRQAALGLQHAHDQGMVHRDVKPANILVTWDTALRQPVAKILDLGLARILDTDDDEGVTERIQSELSSDSADAELTQVGAVVGTPDYLAPEQILRDTPVNERTDVYGLGCTLYKLLAGRVPFDGDTIKSKILKRLAPDAAPPPLRQFVPKADARLEAILNKMLAREPRDRIASAEEVAQYLEPYTRKFEQSWADVCPHLIDAPRKSLSGSRDFSSDERLEDFLNEMGAEAQWSFAPKETATDSGELKTERKKEQYVPAALVELPPLRPVPRVLEQPAPISGEFLLPPKSSTITIPVWVAGLVAMALIALISVSIWAFMQ